MVVATVLCWGWSAASEASAIIVAQTSFSVGTIGPNEAFGSMGQTFTADASLGLFLDDFTFYTDNVLSSTLTYDADVYAWNGTTVTGPALFTSGPFDLAGTGQLGVFVPITITADLATPLTAGKQYIALLTIVGVSPTGGAAFLEADGTNPYAGGMFVLDFSKSTLLSGWMGIGFDDLATTINFSDVPVQTSAVPEPASMLLLGTGLLVAGIRRYRRRSR
jgi:hypothetical protein